MKQFNLECGAVLNVRHVPTVIIEAKTIQIWPEPRRPTYKHALGPDVFTEREYEDADYHAARRAWAKAYELRFMATAINLAVRVSDNPFLTDIAASVDIDDESLRFGVAADALIYVMLRSTSGKVTRKIGTGKAAKVIEDDNELERLVNFIRSNEFSFAEVEAAARSLKSGG